MNVSMFKDEIFIDVDDCETLLEVKQKLTMIYGIPISKQLLFFNGKLLNDNDTIFDSNLIEDSCIRLQVAPNNLINVQVTLPFTSNIFSFEMDDLDSISTLRKKVLCATVPWWRFIKNLGFQTCLLLQIATRTGRKCFFSSDNMSLREYGVSNNTILDGIILLRLQNEQGGGNRLNVEVWPKCKNGKVWIQFEVKGCDKVSVLRKKLDKIDVPEINLLPLDGVYHMSHNQKLMDENHSFLWHGVNDGDKIELLD